MIVGDVVIDGLPCAVTIHEEALMHMYVLAALAGRIEEEEGVRAISGTPRPPCIKDMVFKGLRAYEIAKWEIADRRRLSDGHRRTLP